MKIKVNRIVRQGGTLDVVFGQPIHDTPEGIRALRILLSFAYTGYSVDGRTNTIRTGGGNVAAINTLSACQATMDRMANQPLTLTFEPIRVGATGYGSLLTTVAQAHAALDRGAQVWASMVVKLSLPVLHYDQTALETALPHAEVGTTENGSGLYLNARYFPTDDRTKAYPWDLMRAWQQTVRQIIR